MDGVEPEGDLGQLDGDGIEVDAEDVAVGNHHAHLAGFLLDGVMRDVAVEFLLLAPDVGIGQLVDRLVEEGGGPHGRLADGQPQDRVGGLPVDVALLLADQLLEGVFHQAAGQRSRGVVGGGFLARPTGQAVDEAAAFVPEQAVAGGIGIDALVFGIVGQFIGGDEECLVQRVPVVGGLLDLVEVLLGEEAAVGEQPLVHGTELDDPELGVADASAPLVASVAGAGQG